MKVQQVAHDILKEKNTPMSSKELAKVILNKGLISSNAKDPIQSFASTLERNIRDGVYNKPKLVFISKERGQRLIGLPSWKKAENNVPTYSVSYQELRLRIPSTLFEKIQWASQAKIANSFDETVVKLLEAAIEVMSTEIREGIEKQINILNL